MVRRRSKKRTNKPFRSTNRALYGACGAVVAVGVTSAVMKGLR